MRRGSKPVPGPERTLRYHGDTHLQPHANFDADANDDTCSGIFAVFDTRLHVATKHNAVLLPDVIIELLTVFVDYTRRFVFVACDKQ